MTAVRRIEGNRVHGLDGSVWAVWRVDLPTYPFLPQDAKLALHARVREALVALPARSQLVSVCRTVGDDELARRVHGGAAAWAADAWRATSAADLAVLGEAAPVERRTYLAAQIVAPHARSILDTALAGVAAWFGVPPPPTRRADDQAAAQRAAEVARRVGRTLPVLAADPTELRWLHARAPLRGVVDLAPPAPAPGRSRHIGDEDAVLWEGGTREDPRRPRHRRYLRVDTDRGVAFQSTAVLSEMPAAFPYPGGGEWFGAADLAPFPVDWFARIRAVPNGEARDRAKRQQRQLAAQYAEYEGEPAGPPQMLAAAIEGIDDQQAALAANPGDPELQVAIGFTVAGATPAEVDARVDVLADLLEPWGYALHRPTGGQVALYAAGLPGTAAPPVCDDYLQHLLPRDLAAGAPIAGVAVGDPCGVPMGLTASGGLAEPVLIDPGHGPATNRSGSMGVFGALGSGKSYFVKRLLLGTIARGGQLVTLDRTTCGEYAALADAAAGTTEVVRLDDSARVGLDPLRVFTGEDAVRVALGVLTILTRTTPSDVDGAMLASAVRRTALAGGRLGDVMAVLDRDGAPEAAGLRRKLDAYAEHPLARVVFGGSPPLRLDADLVVFHTPGLSLPDRDAMVHEHLARQLLPEQVFAQALLYLVAAVARTFTFTDPTRFGATLVDEAWALTASPQGRQLLLDSIRDGRKHNAAVWLLSQHPDDLGDDALSHLLGMRVLFRQDRGAAPAALRFLGLPASEDLVELLADHLQTGQCLMRDVTDRVGLVQVLPAGEEAVRNALDTTPAAAA